MDTELKKQLTALNNDRTSILKYAKAMTNMPLDSLVSKSQTSKILQKYTREQIQTWLNSPQNYENKLREVVDYLCTISPQFCRLIEYIPNMAIITPFVKQNLRKYSTKNVKKKKNDYNNMCDYYEMLDIKKTSMKILKEVFKYGVFYGLEIEGAYSIYLKRLPPDFCKIISEGESGLGIAFNMSYFNNCEYLLDNGYPKVFRQLYDAYKKGERPLEGMKLYAEWQPIPVELTFVVKYDLSNLNYSIPPYVNIFNSLYDLEEYQSLNKAKVSAENYTLIGLKIPTLQGADKEDSYAVSSDMIDATTDMLDNSLPEYMGYFTTGADIIPVKASTSSDSKVDQVSNAVEGVWNGTGFASVMFGVKNDNSGTLSYSVKVDEQQLFGIYDQLQSHWNYRLMTKFKNNFKLELLRTTWFNIFDLLDKYLQCSQMSVPVAQIIPLLLGFEITDIDDLSSMQEIIFEIYDKWKPLASSFTSSNADVTDKGGKPKSDDSKISESGQQTRNNESNTKR